MKTRGRFTTQLPRVSELPTTSKRVPFLQAATEEMKWREFINPIRDLDMAKIVSWLEWDQRGVFPDVQWAYIFIERYALLASLVERRLAALDELSWSIKATVDKKSDRILANEQKAFLQERYAHIQNVDELITEAAMTAFRGFTIAQPINASGEVDFINPEQLVCFDRWNFCRLGRNGDFYWNPRALPQMPESLGEKNRVDPDSIILHECDRPIDRSALIIFQRQQECEKNWDGFIWIFGIPLPIIIGPDNVPADKEREYEAAAAMVSTGGTGYLPHGSSVKYPEHVRIDSPFKQRLDYLREEIVLMATGGLLSILSTPNGGGSSQQHGEAFKQIMRAEAKRISRRVFQKYLDDRMLAAEFPGYPALAYFEISANEVFNPSEVVRDAAVLAKAGFAITQADIEERTGYLLEPLPNTCPALLSEGRETA